MVLKITAKMGPMSMGPFFLMELA